MSEYSFSTSTRPRPLSLIPRPTMPPPSLKKPLTKPETPLQFQDEKNSNKVRRLSSLSQLAKSFGRRKGSSDEISGSQITLIPTTSTDVTSHGIATGPLGSQRSSPHPSKAILPRSSTTSNLPVPSSVSTTASPVGRIASSRTVTHFAPVNMNSPKANPASDKANRRLSLQPRAIQLTSSANAIASQTKNRAVDNKKVQRYSMAGSTFASDFNKENFPRPLSPDQVSAPRKWSYNSNSSVRGSTDESRRQLRQSIDEMFPIATPKATKPPVEVNHPSAPGGTVTPPKPQRMNIIEEQSPRSPIRAHGIVHHQLMKTLSPSDVQHTSKIMTAQTSSRNITLEAGNADARATEIEKGISRYAVKPFASMLTAITRRQSQGNMASPLESLPEQSPDRFIYKAQPSAFWTGRFISLNDRLMNESSKLLDPTTKKRQPAMHGNEQLRIRKVFSILEDQCKTKAAQKSLTQFKAQFAIIRKMPELLIAPLSAGLNLDATYTGRESESSDSYYSNSSAVDSEILKVQTQLLTDTLTELGKPASQTTLSSQVSDVTQHGPLRERKSSFMERLMGKGRRQSEPTSKELT